MVVMRPLYLGVFLALHLSIASCRLVSAERSEQGTLEEVLPERHLQITRNTESAWEMVRNDQKRVNFRSTVAEPIAASSFAPDRASLRLESTVSTDASVSGVVFQVRQEGTRYRSYSATKESGSTYSVVVDNLLAGDYTWRVAARKTRQYDFSEEFTFQVRASDIGQPIATPTKTPTDSPTPTPTPGTPAPVATPSPVAAPQLEPTDSPTMLSTEEMTSDLTATDPPVSQDISATPSPTTSPVMTATLRPTTGTETTPSPSESIISMEDEVTETPIATEEPISTTGAPSATPSAMRTPVPSTAVSDEVSNEDTFEETPNEVIEEQDVPIGTTPAPTAANVTPEPTVRVSPEPTTAGTPEPTAAATPEATVGDTPEPTAASTPETTVGATPEPTVATTPVPTTAATLEPTAGATPEPTAAATPEPTAGATPEPTAVTTPEPSPAPTMEPTPAPILPPTPGPVPAISTTAQFGLQEDCNSVDPSKFNICLDLRSESGQYETWMDAFALARNRWEEIIVDDGDPPRDLRDVLSGEDIATGLPSVVDDMYVACSVVPIDGEGRILGMAGPTLIKADSNGNRIPVAGVMEFDKDDVDALGDEEWNNVIKHELAHVLGFGTMFELNGLHSGSTDSDLYLGEFANAEWETICPGGRIPIETDGGEGTAGGHWDEDCLAGELMTGFLGDEFASLSRLSIAALRDIGYGVNMDAADPYSTNDLDNCGSYCPTLRRTLRARKSYDRSMERVSKAGHQQVLSAAAKAFAIRRSEAPVNLPSDMMYIGGEAITVYIRDFDGRVKGERVMYKETQHLMAVDNIFDHTPSGYVLGPRQ